LAGGNVPWGNLAAFPLAMLVGVVVALLAGPAPRAAFALGFVTLAMPWLAAPEMHWVRFFTAMGAVMIVLRALDLLRDERHWPAHRRLWLVFSIYDSRDAKFVPKSFDARGFAMALGFGTLAAAAGIVITRNPDSLALRWAAGVVFAYACADCAGQTVNAVMRLVGVQIPPFHEHPLLSRSLGEFWGLRWNLTVRALLDRHCFRPLARRRMARLGLMAAFGLSAAWHFYLMWPTLGLWMACWWLAFFLIHGLLVLLENRLRLSRWPTAAARAWTIGWFLVTSPLFVEPALRTFFG
jgi:membrane bound O-acyltransferase family protein